jgi:pimeloyl-ACP methyl ester carboxylesterase
MKVLSRLLPGIVLLSLLAAASARGDEFNSAGVTMHYDDLGKGEPVILIHGLYASARMNRGIARHRGGPREHYRVIALDCRGHGQSGKPEAEGAYGTNMVEDVVRLMDHLHIAQARVVGYSMGGMITMKLLATHPDRVSSAVLGGMGWHKADAPMNHFWEAVNGQGRRNVPVACLHGFPALAVTEAELKTIKVPVTIIVGDRDPCRRWYVEPLQKVRTDWPVHLIADAGHLNCIGKPFQSASRLRLAARRIRSGFSRPIGHYGRGPNARPAVWLALPTLVWSDRPDSV